MFFQSAKPKVLVVDDDTNLLRLAKVRLERRDQVNVITAESAEKALEATEIHDFSLIILDWMLPGLQGIDLLSELKADQTTQHIPVLMMTGRNKIAELDEAFDRGADAYIVKPFELRDFGSKVKALLAA